MAANHVTTQFNGRDYRMCVLFTNQQGRYHRTQMGCDRAHHLKCKINTLLDRECASAHVGSLDAKAPAIFQLTAKKRGAYFALRAVEHVVPPTGTCIYHTSEYKHLFSVQYSAFMMSVYSYYWLFLLQSTLPRRSPPPPRPPPPALRPPTASQCPIPPPRPFVNTI